MCGNEYQQQANHTDEVVMIQVGALVHKLDVTKAYKQWDYCETIKQTGRYQQRWERTNYKKDISVVVKRFDKFKAVKREEILWLDVQIIYPPLRPESRNTSKDQQTENDPEYS